MPQIGSLKAQPDSLFKKGITRSVEVERVSIPFRIVGDYLTLAVEKEIYK